MAATAQSTLFDRILVGVDASPESDAAVQQALELLAPAGTLHVVAATNRPPMVAAGFTTMRLAQELEEQAAHALARAAELAPAAVRHLSEASGLRALLDGAHTYDASLVVVGSHGTARAAGIALGSVATAVLHNTTCAVLVARGVPGPRFPQRIVVGVDGSPGAELAQAAAEELAARTGGSVQVVTADSKPVRALVEAAADADLVVVGSRGLHGLRALGSVSERVAHEAPCSVLVVRQQRPRA